MSNIASKSILKKYSQLFPVGSARGNITQILVKRRQKHLKHLDSFCFFSGVPHEPGMDNIWFMNGVKIIQEPSIFYLTGINQTHIYLFLAPHYRQKEILFIPPKDSKKEFWDGVRFGLSKSKSKQEQEKKEITTLTGIKNIYPTSDLDKIAIEIINSNPSKKGYCFYHQSDDKSKVIKTDRNYKFYKKVLSWNKKIKNQKVEILPFCQKHYNLRLPLDTYQTKDALKANNITSDGFKSTLKEFKIFTNENEVGRFLEYQMLKKSPFGLSFPSIIASGKNATTLHYLKNDDLFKKDNLILMDFGVRYGSMHADISRTIPINGKFNPLQKILYQIILDASKYNEKNAIVGATIDNLNKKVWSFIENRLKKDFLFKGGKALRKYELQPHGVSHLMGEQEHDGDAWGLYKKSPLKEGWQISNEPGIYGFFSIKIKNILYKENIGIRIEDNLIIQKEKPLNLSKNIPKEISHIERLMKD